MNNGQPLRVNIYDDDPFEVEPINDATWPGLLRD